MHINLGIILGYQLHGIAISGHIWRLCCQKQVSQAGISNYIPQFTVGCNEVHIYSYTLPSTKCLDQFHKSYNAPVPYPTMHHTELRCAYLYSECELLDMGQVHCGIQNVGIFLTERNRALGCLLWVPVLCKYCVLSLFMDEIAVKFHHAPA